MSVAQADGDAGVDWSEPYFNGPGATDDERLAKLADQSERLAGKGKYEKLRSVELLEDDARYLTQELNDRDMALQAWEAWYQEAPEPLDEAQYWQSWFERAPRG